MNNSEYSEYHTVVVRDMYMTYMYVCGTVCICELHVRMSYVMYMYSCTCITITIVHVHTCKIIL